MVFQKLTDEHKALINQFKEQGKSNQELSQIRAKLMRGYKHDNGNFLPPVKPEAKETTNKVEKKPKPKQEVQEINNDKTDDKPKKAPKKTKAKPKQETEQLENTDMIVKLS